MEKCSSIFFVSLMVASEIFSCFVVDIWILFFFVILYPTRLVGDVICFEVEMNSYEAEYWRF